MSSPYKPKGLSREDIPDLLADRATMLKEIERLQKCLADKQNADIVIAATCAKVNCYFVDEESVDSVKYLAAQLEEARKDRIELLGDLSTLQCDLASIFDWDTQGKTIVQCVRELVQERNDLKLKAKALEDSIATYKKIMDLCQSIKEAIENPEKEPKIYE